MPIKEIISSVAVAACSILAWGEAQTIEFKNIVDTTPMYTAAQTDQRIDEGIGIKSVAATNDTWITTDWEGHPIPNATVEWKPISEEEWDWILYIEHSGSWRLRSTRDDIYGEVGELYKCYRNISYGYQIGTNSEYIVASTNPASMYSAGLMSANDKAKLESLERLSQPDWNQTDENAPDYIKNKPTSVSAFSNDAGYADTNELALATKVHPVDVSQWSITKSDPDSGYYVDHVVYSNFWGMEIWEAVSPEPFETVYSDVTDLDATSFSVEYDGITFTATRSFGGYILGDQTNKVVASTNTATSARAGLMSSGDKQKLDGYPENLYATSIPMSATDNTTIYDGKVSWAGDKSIAFGDSLKASGSGYFSGGKRTRAGEVKSSSFLPVSISHNYALVWSGIDGTRNPYTGPAIEYWSHGDGTFNINPTNGIDGIWIGESKFADVITNLVSNVGFDYLTIGTRSNDMENAVTIGPQSLAQGQMNVASAEMAHAEGWNTVAKANATHTEGNATFANMFAAHAEGAFSHATNQHAHAEGNSTWAGGDASHAEGHGTHTIGFASHAEGIGTYSIDYGTHAEGIGTFAGTTQFPLPGMSSQAAHAEGAETRAFGMASHTEGSLTETSPMGIASHAEGIMTKVTAPGAHAEGFGLDVPDMSDPSVTNHLGTAAGYFSHSEGAVSTAKGFASHVGGFNAHDGSDTNASSFVWQGYAGRVPDNTELMSYFQNPTGEPAQVFFHYALTSTPEYVSHGPGTFNVNPVGGANGFYIGQDTLADLLLSAGGVMQISWEGLKSKLDSSTLVAGQQYRITNYVATTSQSNTMATNHVFDIIVTAEAQNKVNEDARAALHDGDTYFAQNKLGLWRLRYSVLNDTARFSWADASGKGVVYRLVDEFNNDCPYDFKNILFKRWDITGISSAILSPEALSSLSNALVYAKNGGKRYFYQSSSQTRGSITISVGSDTAYHYTFDSGAGEDYSINKSMQVHDNRIAPYENTKLNLNGIVFFGDLTYGNTFENNCYGMTFGNYSSNNKFGYSCYGNVIKGCSNSRFGSNCQYNTAGGSFILNDIKDSCSNNTFGNNCGSNTIGDFGVGNTFGNHCTYNTLGGSTTENVFGNECQRNRIGDACEDNVLGNYCYGNVIGSDSYENTFGEGSSQNTIGGQCGGNKMGESCGFNSIGAFCTLVIFGDANGVKDLYSNIIVEPGVSLVYLNCTSTTADDYEGYMNVTIKSGIAGEDLEHMKSINDSNYNQTYNTTFKPANSIEVEVP